jgi:glycosyltransferase involved in cell wall biosynthesis
MRIAVAHESVDTDGGVETYLVSAITELRRRGHQIALVYFRRSTSRSALLSSPHISIGIEERGLDRAMDDLRAWNPDVCYSHNMGPLGADRAMLEGWPVVKMLHGFFGTCVSGLKMHAWPTPQACHRTFGPACLALYFPRRCGRLSPSGMIQGYRWAREQRDLFDRYASIVVASRYMHGEVARHGVAPGRIDILPLFSTMPSGSAHAAGEKDTVLFAGRMTMLKGGHVLIAATARAQRMLGRPVPLVMAGDGPQKESWRQLARSHGVQVDMPGWIAFERRAQVYGRGALVAVPSLWPEPFGLIGLDAASIGRPAVAFDVGGVREWLTDGATGMLVDPAAGEAGLADAIASLLERPDDRERMGRAALDVSRRMTVAAHVEKLEIVLRAAAS